MTVVQRFAEDFNNVQACHIDVVDGVLMISLIDESSKVLVIRSSKINVCLVDNDNVENKFKM